MTDALEILAAQHAHIDGLLARLRTATARRLQLVDELADYVTAHLAVEQELFYPHVAVSNPVHTELLAEHAEIKRVLANLLWLDDDDARFPPTLDALVELLTGHIAWQDDQLFEQVAEGMTPGVLAELGASLQGGFDSMRGDDLARAA
jgi:hypothetical protein